MSLYEIVVDFGGDKIKAGLRGNGRVRIEPSVVAVPWGAVELLCGNEINDIPEEQRRGYRLERPVSDGLIVNKELAAKLVNSVCRRLLSQESKEPEVCATIAVSEGLSEADLKAYEETFAAAGIQPIRFIDSGLACGAEAFAEFNVGCGTIVNIGYDKTEISVVYGGEVVEGCCILIGGRDIDSAVCDVIENRYGILVNLEQASEIKNGCVRFLRSDASTVMARGTSVRTSKPAEVRVSARDFFETACRIMEPVVLAVNSVYNSLDERILREVKYSGVFLAGGCAMLYGIESFFANCLLVPSRVMRNPVRAVINGMMRKRKGE